VISILTIFVVFQQSWNFIFILEIWLFPIYETKKLIIFFWLPNFNFNFWAFFLKFVGFFTTSRYQPSEIDQKV
jgi:hypothetical protein